MPLYAELTGIEDLAQILEDSAQAGGKVAAPVVDLGPSTAAGQATLAEILRAESGLAESSGRTAADLAANKATYATTDTANADLFRPIGH